MKLMWLSITTVRDSIFPILIENFLQVIISLLLLINRLICIQRSSKGFDSRVISLLMLVKFWILEARSRMRDFACGSNVLTTILAHGRKCVSIIFGTPSY